jgi:hypothetical protein
MGAAAPLRHCDSQPAIGAERGRRLCRLRQHPRHRRGRTVAVVLMLMPVGVWFARAFVIVGAHGADVT